MATTETVVDRELGVLSDDAGVPRCQHGHRLFELF
jgi:hypothetical protein